MDSRNEDENDMDNALVKKKYSVRPSEATEDSQKR